MYFRNVTINRLFSGLFFRFRLGILVKINLVVFFHWSGVDYCDSFSMPTQPIDVTGGLTFSSCPSVRACVTDG